MITNMSNYPLTKEQLFVEVWDYFITGEHKQCIDDSGECVYRDEDGNGCAVGCVIPDEWYNDRIEGKFVRRLPKSLLKRLFADDEVVRFASELQTIHDNGGWRASEFTENMKRGMLELKKKHGLEC